MATTLNIRNYRDAEQLEEMDDFQPMRKQGQGRLQPKQLERLERSRRSTPRQEALGRRGSGRYREATRA